MRLRVDCGRFSRRLDGATLLAERLHEAKSKKSSLYEHGHPQCRRNVTTTGFPFALGMASRSDDGAFDPIAGASLVFLLSGESQDVSSCCKVILISPAIDLTWWSLV